MYSPAMKRAIKKYVLNNKVKHNAYQKEKQKEYYKLNSENKLRKQKEYYRWKTISLLFRNILLSE